MKKNILTLSLLSFLVLPILAFAQTPTNPTPPATNTINTVVPSAYCSDVPDKFLASTNKLGDAIKFIACFLEQFIVPFLFALAVVIFVYGVVKFIGTGDSSEREQGKQFMLWGIIALAVMFCVWGLVQIFGDTLGVKSIIPQLPVNPTS